MREGSSVPWLEADDNYNLNTRNMAYEADVTETRKLL